MKRKHTSSLDDLSWRGGVAGDAWLSRSGNTLLVRVFGVPPLFSARFYIRGKRITKYLINFCWLIDGNKICNLINSKRNCTMEEGGKFMLNGVRRWFRVIAESGNRNVCRLKSQMKNKDSTISYA